MERLVSDELRHAFNRFRSIGRTAEKALKNARDDIARGARHYTSSPWRKPVGNGARVDGKQWIEKPANMGLRFVGYCDELVRIDHTGWFTDEYQDSKLRGVVYQLPGRNGRARFVIGHDDSDNRAGDNGGPAYVDFSGIYESDFAAELATANRQIGKAYWTPAMDSPGYWAEAAHESARKEAARAADSFAENEADKAREYNAAWQAGVDYAETIATRKSDKAELRQLLAERRQAKTKADESTGAICRAVEYKARELIEAIQNATDKAGELLGYYYSPELRAAFNDGAGETVLA